MKPTHFEEDESRTNTFKLGQVSSKTKDIVVSDMKPLNIHRKPHAKPPKNVDFGYIRAIHYK